MKRLLLAAIALAATISTSDAGGNKVPSDMIGNWCDYSGTGRATYMLFDEACKRPNVLKIDGKGYSIFEMRCTFTSVTTGVDYKQPRDTDTMGALVMQIKSSCKRDDCRWEERGNFSFSKGALYVTRHNSKLSCPSG